MKKTMVFMAIVAIAFCSVLPINAQLRFGVKGGLNLANNNISDLVTSGLQSTINSKNMTGFYIGPTTEFTIPIIGLGLDASLLYSQKGSEYNIDVDAFSATVKDKVHYIDIPVNLKYKFSLLLAGVYISAGPYVSYAISGSRSLSDVVGDRNNINKSSFYKEFDYGINVGAGVELLKHLQLGVSYSFGLNDAAKNEMLNGQYGAALTSFDAKNRVFSVNVAYMF